MQTEASTPATSRYLHLISKLAPSQFGREKTGAIAWCEANAQKLLPSHQEALAQLRNFKLSDHSAAVVVHRCYAPMP